MIQIQTVRMFTIFYCTKLHLSECNGSWVVSTELNMNFLYSTVFHVRSFGFSQKMVLWKVFSYVEDLSVYKICHTLTGANFRPPQKFGRPGLWNGWRYGIKKVVPGATFSGLISLLNLIYLLIGSKFVGWTGGHRWTDSQTCELSSLFHFLWK
jgi:hypothetical protein